MTLHFPEGFVWGSATAALQIEGAAAEDGRGPSMWDVYCRLNPQKIFEQATPEVACDHYHRFEEDVRLMKEMGHTGYRLSISWPRLFPQGGGDLNPEGARFYDRLFEALHEAGVAPNVTLYHWDLPQPLAANGGWENEATIEPFVAYARTCFARWGGRVRLWATFNEPSWSTLNGYVTGLHPPGRQDARAGASAVWNILRAHARVVEAFRERGGAGAIGIALNLSPVHPVTASPADADAARVADGLLNRIFLEPVLLGRIPEDIEALGRAHGLLPEMNDADRRLLERHPVDFVGVNYYYPHHATADAGDTQFFLNISGRREEECAFSIRGLFRFARNPKGRYTDWAWEIDPGGLQEILVRIARLRPGVAIYVTENGIGLNDQLVHGRVADDARIAFVREHLAAVHGAIAQGADVRGYYMWALMDNFSWLNGYKKRYGFLYVDRKTLARHKKKSAFWFQGIAHANALDD